MEHFSLLSASHRLLRSPFVPGVRDVNQFLGARKLGDGHVQLGVAFLHSSPWSPHVALVSLRGSLGLHFDALLSAESSYVS